MRNSNNVDLTTLEGKLQPNNYRRTGNVALKNFQIRDNFTITAPFWRGRTYNE